MQVKHIVSDSKKPAATLIHVKDLSSGRTRKLSKSELLDPNEPDRLMSQILARRHEFTIHCGCKTDDRATLYARKRKDLHEICNQPSEVWNHDPLCGYWTEPSPAAPSDPLVRDRESSLRDLFNVRSVGAKAHPKRDWNEASRPRSIRPRRHARRASNSLAAAVLALLDFAGMNRCQPEASTSWSENAIPLANAIRTLASDRVERAPLPSVATNEMPLDLSSLPERHSNGIAIVTPRLALCLIASCRVEGSFAFFRIEGFDREIRMEKANWRYSIKHSPSRHASKALNDLHTSPRAPRVLALLELTRNESQEVIAHRAGLCVTSAELVPVESSFELAMTNYLVKNARAFIKDIYVPEGYLFRHDFRLLDTAREFLIEVKGMNTPEYNESKRAVEDHLANTCVGGFVIWSAVQGDPLPELPPKFFG